MHGYTRDTVKLRNARNGKNCKRPQENKKKVFGAKSIPLSRGNGEKELTVNKFFKKKFIPGIGLFSAVFVDKAES